MLITLSPYARLPSSKESLTAVRTNQILILNGHPFDFSLLPDGATLPAGAIESEWIVGPVERVEGVLHITLRLPHGPNPPHHVAFPETIAGPPDGPIALPVEGVQP